jgi:hypothetical protein
MSFGFSGHKGTGYGTDLIDTHARHMPYRAERAAGALSRKVLTLSRDIAFLSNPGIWRIDGSMDDLAGYL